MADTRGRLRFWGFVSLIAGAVCFALATTDAGLWRFVLALGGIWGFALGSVYLATVRWMDRHATWQ